MEFSVPGCPVVSSFSVASLGEMSEGFTFGFVSCTNGSFPWSFAFSLFMCVSVTQQQAKSQIREIGKIPKMNLYNWFTMCATWWSHCRKRLSTCGFNHNFWWARLNSPKGRTWPSSRSLPVPGLESHCILFVVSWSHYINVMFSVLCPAWTEQLILFLSLFLFVLHGPYYIWI